MEDMTLAVYDNLQNKIVDILRKMHIIKILSVDNYMDVITDEHKFSIVHIKTLRWIWMSIVWVLERVITDDGYSRRKRLDDEIDRMS